MYKSDYLEQGDLIRIVSPAGKIEAEKILPAVDLLNKNGFNVLLGEHIFNTYYQFAGTDEQRLGDLQEALDDPDCKAIICSRGGYGAIRIADKLDFSSFKKNPKWLVGFSDVTTLHALLQGEGFCSIHGSMPSYYLSEGQPTESFVELKKLLTGGYTEVNTAANKYNRTGQVSGQLVGGNLSILYSLMGTPLEPDMDGKILFVEDLCEYLYHLDRIMHSLKLSGKLGTLKGLLVGQFTDMKDNDSCFGQTVEEIILNTVKSYSYPVCFNFPAGHVDRNLPLIFGEEYILNVTQKGASLSLV